MSSRVHDTLPTSEGNGLWTDALTAARKLGEGGDVTAACVLLDKHVQALRAQMGGLSGGAGKAAGGAATGSAGPPGMCDMCDVLCKQASHMAREMRQSQREKQVRGQAWV